MEIPGATLKAGTYTFEIADPNASRHVVRVSEKDTNKPITLFMTIPTERMDPPSDSLVMFSERPAGSPQAIQAWFYPGDRTGEEFVYPRSQAVRIAKANRKPVLATADTNGRASASESDRMTRMRSSDVGRVNESGTMTSEPRAKASDRPSTTVASSDSDNRMAQNEPPRRQRRELPQTASNFAAIGLSSILALGLAFLVRRIRLAAR